MVNGGPSTKTVYRLEAEQALSKEEGTRLGPRLTAVIAEAISDEFSIMILNASILKGKTVGEICAEQGIPPSTCYKRVGHLVDEGVMVVERMVVASTARKYAIYRSTFSLLDVRLENGVVSAYATLNPAAASKLRNTSRSPDSSWSPPKSVLVRHASRRQSTSRSGVS